MSSPRDGGGLPAASAAQNPPIDLSNDPDQEDSVSESSYAGSGASEPHEEEVCRYRTTRFHDQECARYFDCPTHLVERVLSDAGEDEDGEDQQEHREESHDVVMSEAGEEEEEDDEIAGGEDVVGDAVHEEAERDRPEGSPVMEAEEVRPATPHMPGDTADNPIVLEDSTPAPSRIDRRPEPRQVASGGRAEAGPSSAGAPASLQHIAAFEAPQISRMTSLQDSLSMASQRQAQVPTLAQIHRPMEAQMAATAVRSGPPEFAVPRWQPDAEVTYCPICHTQFSIFVRKHHCRKCGRVVCAACSPHRITIPHQYIVRPPWDPIPAVPRYPSRLLEHGAASLDFGGGDRVRLCNPCVPDPNITPPQTQGAHSRSQSGLSQTPQPSISPVNARWSSYFIGSSPAGDAHVRSRSVTMQSGNPSASAQRHPQEGYRQRPIEDRILSGTPPVYFQPGTNQNPRPLPGFSSASRRRATPGSSSSPFDRHLPLPPLPPLPPQRDPQRRATTSIAQSSQQHHQIAEEDECPVCHRELPPRTLPNYEALREAHITICITAHSTYSGTVAAGPSTGNTPSDPPLPRVPPRRTGMFPYTATEKDCIDSAECTICLEEFEVGVNMARLECLCRFHRFCIDAWWERHPGRCPMHQHEDFGY